MDSERKKKNVPIIFCNRKFRFGFWSKSDLYRIWRARVIIMCVRARARAFASTTRSMCALYISSFAIYLTIIRFSNKSGRQLCGDIFLYFFLIVYPTNGKISRLVIDFERGESIATMMISIAGTIHDGNRARVERDSRSRDRFVYIYIYGRKGFSSTIVSPNSRQMKLYTWQVTRRKKYIEISHW